MIDSHVSMTLVSEGLIDTVCSEAIRLGRKGIAFTQPLLPAETQQSHKSWANYGESAEIIFQKKMHYFQMLKIYKGIELHTDFTDFEATMNIASRYPVDYVLASADPSVLTVSSPDEELRKLKYLRYINGISCIEPLIEWAYMAAGSSPGEPFDSRQDRMDWLDMLLKALISEYKCIELNVNFITTQSEQASFVADKLTPFLTRYHELGGSLISLATRSGSVQQLSASFEYYQQLLLQTGFRYTTHFAALNPVHDSLT